MRLQASDLRMLSRIDAILEIIIVIDILLRIVIRHCIII